MSLNITTVNDVPVATDAVVILAEDNTRRIDLLALASNIDSSKLGKRSLG